MVTPWRPASRLMRHMQFSMFLTAVWHCPSNFFDGVCAEPSYSGASSPCQRAPLAFILLARCATHKAVSYSRYDRSSGKISQCAMHRCINMPKTQPLTEHVDNSHNHFPDLAPQSYGPKRCHMWCMHQGIAHQGVGHTHSTPSIIYALASSQGCPCTAGTTSCNPVLRGAAAYLRLRHVVRQPESREVQHVSELVSPKTCSRKHCTTVLKPG